MTGSIDEVWYCVSMPHYVCGIIVKDKIVIDTAPIMKWVRGKKFEYVKKWVKRKGGEIKELPSEEEID